MATFTPQLVSVVGTTLTMNACNAGGDSIPAGSGTVVLIVRNADASSHTVTVVRPNTTYGTADPDVPVTVAAGATVAIPLQWSADFVNTATATVDLTYSAVTSQTMAVVRVL